MEQTVKDTACTKVKYASKEFADADIKRINEKSTREKIPCRSYWCYKCKCWHLTSRGDMEMKDEQIEQLKHEIQKLKTQIENKPQENSKLSSLEKLKIRKDETIRQLRKIISEKNKEIQRLRKDRNELIMKNFKMEREKLNYVRKEK